MSRFHRVGDVFVPIASPTIQHFYEGMFFIIVEKTKGTGWWKVLNEEGQIIVRSMPPNHKYWKFVENMGNLPKEGWKING